MDTNEFVDIPEGFTPWVFKMDPVNHEMIYGSELENGMIVLIADTLMRVDASNRPTDGSETVHSWNSYDEERYLIANRWCVVESLRKLGDIIQFIGTYSDGTQFSRRYDELCCWYVLIDTM